MPPKNYVAGFGDADPDAADFLRPSNTDPYKASASGVGYNARWDDDRGTSGKRNNYGDSPWGDNSDFVPADASYQGDYDAPHQRLSALLDDQADQPAGKILGGGGPVSNNKIGGVGPGKPRFAPKAGGPRKLVNPDSRGGVDRSGRR